MQLCEWLLCVKRALLNYLRVGGNNRYVLVLLLFYVYILIDLSLCVFRLVKLPTGKTWFLEKFGGYNPEPDRREAQIRWPEMGPENPVTLQWCQVCSPTSLIYTEGQPSSLCHSAALPPPISWNDYQYTSFLHTSGSSALLSNLVLVLFAKKPFYLPRSIEHLKCSVVLF